MAKKTGKSVSFDAMIKFFINTYSIPTKHDIDRLMARLDHIERLIVNSSAGRSRRLAESKPAGLRGAQTASDIVLQAISKHSEGASFSDIQIQTGFGEKKLRNIIYRLHKLGKIKRKNRGFYQKA